MELPRIGADELVERLEASRERARGGILAFDADGTLWDGDVGIDLFEGALRREAFRPEALDGLRALATRFGIETASDPTKQAKLLYAAFAAEKLPDGDTFEMMAWAFAGHTTASLDALVADVLREASLEARLTRELEPIFDWADDRGVEVVVVSASPRAVVVNGVASLGIDARSVLAMTPKIAGDVIQAALLPPSTYASGKVKALESARPDEDVLGAFGATAFDAEMLRRARLPVAVRPKPALRAKAGDVPGLVELARALARHRGLPHFATSSQQRKPAS